MPTATASARRPRRLLHHFYRRDRTFYCPPSGHLHRIRAFYLVLASVVILLGVWMIIYPLSSGRGFTVGAVLGLVLVAGGTFRLLRERQSC